MHDPDTFESRLASAIRRYASDDPRHIDASALAQAVASDARVRRSTGLHARPSPRTWRVLLAAALLLAAVTGAALVGSQVLKPSPSPLIPAARGVFTKTGSMMEVREEPTATRLLDGRVLVVGGYRAGRLAEVWDPATGLFSPAGVLNQEREGPTATLLQDGRVLVVGGDGPRSDPLRSAEVWDPDTNTLFLTGSPAVAHVTAELLPDGRVLVGPSETAEVWDPGTGTFSPAGSLADGHDFGDGIVLSDGRIVTIDEASAWVKDPVTGSSHQAGVLAQARSAFTATRLLDDHVLVAGGQACLEGAKTGDIGQTARLCSATKLDTAEIWDPATNAFSPTGPMTRARAWYAATLLLDGRVLLVGGRDGGDGRSAEVFELK